MMNVRDRYYTDPKFKRLVDILVYHIQNGDYTPTETREAAMLAQLIFEERNPKMRFVLDDIDAIRRVIE